MQRGRQAHTLRVQTAQVESRDAAGDFIVGVNRRRVGSVLELAQALGTGERAALNVVRGDYLLTIVIR